MPSWGREDLNTLKLKKIQYFILLMKAIVWKVVGKTYKITIDD